MLNNIFIINISQYFMSTSMLYMLLILNICKNLSYSSTKGECEWLKYLIKISQQDYFLRLWFSIFQCMHIFNKYFIFCHKNYLYSYLKQRKLTNQNMVEDNVCQSAWYMIVVPQSIPPHCLFNYITEREKSKRYLYCPWVCWFANLRFPGWNYKN